MHYIGLGQYLKSFEQIFEITKGFFLLKLSLHFDFLFESPSVAVLIDKIVVVGSFEYLDKPNDMSGVLNFAESLYLVDGKLFQFGADFELLNFDDLDGKVAVLGLLVKRELVGGLAWKWKKHILRKFYLY